MRNVPTPHEILKARLKPSDLEKFETAQTEISKIIHARQELRRLGIVRSETSLQGDYAEWIVCRWLGLEANLSFVERGFDAIGIDEKSRYQVKARMVKTWPTSTSFDFNDGEFEFDFLIGVFVSPSFEILGIIQVSRKHAKELSTKRIREDGTEDWRFRWNRKTSADPKVAKILWSETG